MSTLVSSTEIYCRGPTITVIIMAAADISGRARDASAKYGVKSVSILAAKPEQPAALRLGPLSKPAP